MTISVILCTYNRAHSLGTALESVLRSALQTAADWELLVVDNNSRDNTREVVGAFSQRYPGKVRYIQEPKQGLSNARNAGIREARGRILAFVDDDVEVGQQWLQNLTAALHGGEWGGSGGRILPPQVFLPPPWLAIHGPWAQGGVLCAQFDLGDEPVELKEKGPYGTNMAFRKEMFEKYGGFRTDLGRCGDSLMSNEDTEFSGRLRAGAERLRYEPSAIVYHSIPEERLNKRYFRGWWLAYGRSHKREEGVSRERAFCGIPRCYLSLPKIALCVVPPQITQWLMAREPGERFRRECTVWVTIGTMAEIWSQITGRNVTQSEGSLVGRSAIS